MRINSVGVYSHIGMCWGKGHHGEAMDKNMERCVGCKVGEIPMSEQVISKSRLYLLVQIPCP